MIRARSGHLHLPRGGLRGFSSCPCCSTYAALWLPGQWAHWPCRQTNPAPEHEPEIPACTPISVKKAAEAQRRLRVRALSPTPSLARHRARSAIGPCCMLASTFKFGHPRSTGTSPLRTRHSKCLVACQDEAVPLAGASSTRWLVGHSKPTRGILEAGDDRRGEHRRQIRARCEEPLRTAPGSD
jgi:hypothetical protein